MSGFTDDSAAEPQPTPAEDNSPHWKPFEEMAKYTAVLAIMAVAVYFLRKKLADLDWEDFKQGIWTFPRERILFAMFLTVVNYVILTGYDFIAIRYLNKKLSIGKIMTGAVVGYSMSNLFGWIFGGSTVRYRLYSSWGFSLKEIVAFISILSMTFWLGMFLLAGCAFIALPVRLPAWVNDAIPLGPFYLGCLFLVAVLLYLIACVVWRKPIRWGDDEFALPPWQLSAAQLAVSASDFALASATLFVLLPPELTNFSTVLVAYLAAMIVVVTLHAPGGFGILETILIELLIIDDHEQHFKLPLTCALVVYRIVYYFIPGLIGGLLFLWNEYRTRRAHKTGIKNQN
jgi:uncharacterized membrane protein YbhN (UPF0104 family)